MCMGKYKYRANLSSTDENIDINGICIYHDNKISYKENNRNVTIIILDKKVELLRKCNEYEIKLIFEKKKKSKSEYKVFGGTKLFYLETYTNKLNIDSKKIELEYILEGNKFNYVLELEDL